MSMTQVKAIVGDEFMTDKEIAAIFKVTRQQVHVWASAGLFPRHKMGGTTRFRWSEVEKAIKVYKGTEKA